MGKNNVKKNRVILILLIVAGFLTLAAGCCVLTAVIPNIVIPEIIKQKQQKLELKVLENTNHAEIVALREFPKLSKKMDMYSLAKHLMTQLQNNGTPDNPADDPQNPCITDKKAPAYSDMPEKCIVTIKPNGDYLIIEGKGYNLDVISRKKVPN